MAFSLKTFLLGGKTFCCCLPVRFGVIVMSLLSILFSGILSVAIWVETSSHDLSSKERTSFIMAGLVETFLFTASIFGFIGAVVRKQLFVMIYAYFIYGHFVLNVVVAGYFLGVTARATRTDVVKACQGAIQNPQAKAQCTGLLHITWGVFFAVVSFVILVELYGALIVTRYVNQLRSEKRSLRESRLTFRLLPKQTHYANLGSEHNGLPDHASFADDGEFNPYEHSATDYQVTEDYRRGHQEVSM